MSRTVVVVIILSILFTSFWSFAHSKAFGESATPLEFVSNNNTKLESSTVQGGSVQLPVDVKLDKNYQIETISLLLADVPPNVLVWIDPNTLPNQFNQQSPLNGTIHIYADSNSQLGTYTIKILGKGSLKNIATGEDVQVMNTTADSTFGNAPGEFQKMQERTSVTLGLLQLTIKPNQTQITMAVGSRNLHMGNFCVNSTDGNMCSSFPTYDEYPITISSENTMNVKLKAIPIMAGAWLKFVPQQLIIGPTPSTVNMILSGQEEPFLINPHDTRAMMIQAVSDNSIATSYLPMIKIQNLTVINSPAPIQLEGEISPNSNGTNMNTYGVVYDPDDPSKSKLHVSLSVLGLENGTKIIPLPSWLQVKIQTPSFDLNATKPYYFVIQATNLSAPEGTHTVAINETIGGQEFVGHLKISVFNTVYMGIGPASVSSGPPIPQDNGTSNDLKTIPPPIKQFKSGIAAKDVRCKEGFGLILKNEDGSPACVTPQTLQTLVERGWGTSWTIAVTKKTSENSTRSNHVIDIISISGTGSPPNPGGPEIQLTLMNIGTKPVTSLNATLGLNHNYVFNFKDVTESNPLAPGLLASDTEILIGAGSTNGIAYPLTVIGTENNETFSYTLNVPIPYTNENVITNIRK